MKTLTELTITRSKWATPDKTTNGGRLLDDKGLMCCLDFACIDMGFGREQILDRCYPYSICKEINVFVQYYADTVEHLQNTRFAINAACINDDKTISNTEREKLLTELFAANNITLHFID